MKRKLIYLIGVGNFGIHHFEGLLKAKTPLLITVIDNAPETLSQAQNPKGVSHHIFRFLPEIPEGEIVDLAIIATTSGSRAQAIQDLMAKAKKVRYLILEKVLFDKRVDYVSIGNLLKKHRIRTWVNCPRRLLPFHSGLKKRLGDRVLKYHAIAGGSGGLMSNVIHYVDHLCYLTGSTDFKTDASQIIPKLIPSKRKGYFELNGQLFFEFRNGTLGSFTYLPEHVNAQFMFTGKNAFGTLDEETFIASISEKKNHWKWQDMIVPFYQQSEMTGLLVEQILKTGRCALTPYEQSAKIHLAIFEPVRKFLVSKGIDMKNYPFT